MIIFAALGFLRNFAFLSQQNNIVFFILLVHYQQLSMQLVSAFRGRREDFAQIELTFRVMVLRLG